MRSTAGTVVAVTEPAALPPPTTWVLLRGLTRGAAHWGTLPARMRARWPGCEVLTPELPGNGQRHGERSPSQVPAMTEALRTQLAPVLAARPGGVAVLAMSLGAMVATQWAYTAPQELAACVLVNTSFAPFSPFYRRLRPRNYPRLARLVLGGAAPLVWERAILEMTSGRAAARQDVLPAWTQVRQQRPVSVGNALRQLLAAALYRVRKNAPRVPLLLLASERDGLVDVRCSLAVAQHWGCRLHLHPWAGHDLPLDDPDWVIAQVAGWQPVREGAGSSL